MAYTRDLGHGGVRLLLESTTDLPPGVMVTMQNGNLVPVPFEDMIDPETNRTRIRQVDLESYSYTVARAYMIRLEKEDFESPKMLAALAAEAHMTPHAFRARFEHTVTGIRHPRFEAHHPPAGDLTPGEDVVPSPTC
jgi:6-phosphofructokinase 1